jgi:hypothetical protein
LSTLSRVAVPGILMTKSSRPLDEYLRSLMIEQP